MTGQHAASRFDALRLVFGFALLPPVDALLGFLFHRVLWSQGPGGSAQWYDPVQFAIVAAVMAVIVVAVGAVPAVLWLLNHGLASPKRILIAAIALGNMPYAISCAGVIVQYLAGFMSASALAHSLLHGPMGAGRAVTIGSVMGLVSGLVFWTVGIRGTRYDQRALVRLDV
jgi:hypothetical protein